MAQMRIHNGFHGREVTIRISVAQRDQIEEGGNSWVAVQIALGEPRARRIHKRLCTQADCRCAATNKAWRIE